MATIATASSLAKKAGNASTVDASRVCSNGESRKDECGNDALSTESRVHSTQPIHYGGG